MKEKLNKWLTTPSWSWVCIDAAIALFWALDFWLTGRLWTLGLTAVAVFGAAVETVLTVRESQERK